MQVHEFNQFRIRPFRVTQAQFIVGRSSLAQQITRADVQCRQYRPDLRGAGRCLQVLNDLWLFAAVADQGQDLS